MRGYGFLGILCGICSLGQAAYNASLAPLSIPPSLYWDGDDGSWSTFQIQVGTPGQTVRLLPGTSASAGSTIWVVISEGCVDVNPDLANCANERGYLFQSNQSTTWSTKGIQNGVDGAIFSLNTYEEGMLGLVGNASYGYDTVSLGLSGSGLPTIDKQVIAGMWTDDFFLGSLGLSPVPFNFTNLNDPQPSMLSSLFNQSLIPSRSWAYTAGAHYQNPPVFGSLTLGGYDTTRFKQNNLTFAFGADFSRDLLVSLQSVTYDTVGSSPLLASSIDIFIDSLVTEIWLPVAVCNQFAQQFNLTWNSQGELYLISDDAHAALLAQNPTFTFSIGQAGGGGETVDIALPYAAFDLNLTAPIVGNTTRYFPLKQAQNSTQYTLGRTFLQEAYVIADYERRNFSVSQALFPSTSSTEKLVAIDVPGESDDTASKKSGLKAGAIAGIAIAAVAVIAIILAALWWFRRRNKRKQPAAAVTAPAEEPEKPPTPPLETPAGFPKPELDSPSGFPKPELESPSAHPKPELAGDKPAHEMNEGYFAHPELPAYDGPGGRHELGSEINIHEMDSRQVAAVELDATPINRRDISKG